MRAEIKRKVLKTLLNFSGVNNSLVKLACKGDKLMVTFVQPFREDLLFFEKSVPAYVTEEGAGLFQANALGKLKKWADKGANDMLCVDCVAKYSELTAKIVGDDKLCRIPCDGVPDSTWPAYDRDKEIGEIRLDKLKAIIDMAKKGENAGANYDEILSVELSSKGTTLSWTDGCVLNTELDELLPALTNGQILLPVAAVKQLLKHANGASEFAAISKVGIRTDGVSVTFGDLTERPYPDLTPVCEPKGAIAIRTDASMLKTALKQVSSCINWLVILRTKNGRLNVVAFDNGGKNKAWDDCPRAEAWIDAEIDGASNSQHGFDIAFCVDYRYLSVILAKTEGAIKMQCQDEASPIYISVQNSGIKTVLMPVETDFLYKSV